MSYLVLARKYRPQTFEEVVDQEHVTQTLIHSITADRVAHAILFSGPRGTGKTTVARILAKAMNCEKGPASEPCNNCRSCCEITADSAADVFEIDGASNNSVDQVRELRDNIVFMPSSSRYKIYIIDEVHMLSPSAFNALLKTLEEPPPHVLFIFATTEIRKIPITILSRCQRHDMRRIDHGAMTDYLKTMCDREAVDIQPESLSLIARQADGSMRDALSLLDQVMAGSEGAVTHELLLDILGSVDRTTLSELSEALLSADVRRMLSKVGEIYKNGQDLHRVYIDLLAYLRDLMVIQLSKVPDKLVDLPEIEIKAMARQAKNISAAHLNQIFERLYREEVTVRLSSHPRMAMEMVLMKLGRTKPVLPIDTLIEKLDQLKISFDQAPPVASNGRRTSKPSQGEGSKSDSSPPPVSSSRQVKPMDESPTDSVDGIQDPAVIWERICQQASDSSPALAANLTGSSLIVKDDNRLEIEINGGEFNLEMVRRKKNRTWIEQMLRENFGEPANVTIRTNSMVGKQKKTHKEQANQLRKQALDHPIVNEALEIFSGRVEKINIIQEEDQ
ncbi:MAG: DNA polymerase III subunit gamma/tau [Thermodesulfobacteriota bacterium]|nr:DNA polymerase III subunit gamma/tau [Thermodesulfobacteriota bacterium]